MSTLNQTEVKKIVKKKRRKVKIPAKGRAYIHASYNNTIVTLTDEQGNVLGWSSAGKLGFKGPKKATAFAAGVVVKDVVTPLLTEGFKEVDAFIRGVGTGREAAIRALNAHGLNVLTIRDLTPIPHNGCRAPRPRRI